jgi:hypothetical protein
MRVENKTSASIRKYLLVMPDENPEELSRPDAFYQEITSCLDTTKSSVPRDNVSRCCLLC